MNILLLFPDRWIVGRADDPPPASTARIGGRVAPAQFSVARPPAFATAL
ncbi:hypothetical protein [Paludisphaera borealis]|nr:hypothetical protein [Paludisphaera borealis]